MSDQNRPWWEWEQAPEPSQPEPPQTPYAQGPYQSPYQQPYPYPPYGWAPPRAPDPHRGRRRVARALTAVAVAAAAFGGAGLAHAFWPSAAGSGAGSALPAFGGGSGNGGSGNGGSGVPGSGSGSGAGSSGPADAAAISEKVDPAIVDINTTVGYGQFSDQAAGTGMVLTSNGEILTNNHVIEGATSMSVTDVGNGKTYRARVVGYDRSSDVAVIQLIGASGLKTISRGNSAAVQVGAAVVAVGNAGGTGGTPSYAGGSITALNQSITASDAADGTSEQLTGLLETNANVVPGDSGGPLVDSAGRVIGMDTAASSNFQFQTSGTQGFAIPINEALRLAGQIESGSSSADVHIGATAFLGVEISTGNQGRGGGGFPGFGGFGGSGSGSGSAPAGASIAAVVPGGPAAKAGLGQGDTITSVNGASVSSGQALTQQIVALHPGDHASIGYVDPAGQQHTATVTLASGPPQ